MKFKEYVKGINKMLEENPDWGELEMKQAEHYEDEEVCLPDIYNPFMSFDDPVIYL